MRFRACVGYSSCQVETSPPTNASYTREQRAGFALFFAVTGLWTLWSALALTWESGPTALNPWGAVGVVVGVLSAVSVVLTGYLIGPHATLIWLGLVPGGVMAAIGIVGVETNLVFLLWLSFGLLILGWPCVFLPLLGLGALIRSRVAKRRLAPAGDGDSPAPAAQPRLHV